MRFYREGKYVDAINWLGEIEGALYVNQIGKQLIDILMKSGKETLFTVLNMSEINPKLLEKSGKLTFIKDYAEMAELIAGKKAVKNHFVAAQMAIRMIEDELVPKEYLLDVVELILPLLQEKSIHSALNVRLH